MPPRTGGFLLGPGPWLHTDSPRSVQRVYIARIILRVSDIDRSVDFWSESVGLEVVGGGGPFRFLDGGGVQLALNQMEQPGPDTSLTEIVMEVEDVRAAHAEMNARGVPFEVEPRPVMTDDGRELWATHFRDPDGHLASVTGWVET